MKNLEFETHLHFLFWKFPQTTLQNLKFTWQMTMISAPEKKELSKWSEIISEWIGRLVIKSLSFFPKWLLQSYLKFHHVSCGKNLQADTTYTVDNGKSITLRSVVGFRYCWKDENVTSIYKIWTENFAWDPVIWRQTNKKMIAMVSPKETI